MYDGHGRQDLIGVELLLKSIQMCHYNLGIIFTSEDFIFFLKRDILITVELCE